MKFLILIFVTFSTLTLADDVYVFSFKKSEAKRSTRWSLSDWLDQRDRMRMMDLWLALHSPTPYEFFVGATYQVGKNTEDLYYSAWNLHMAGYAKIFGLGLQREMSTVDQRWNALFYLRIFGYHAQGTNITLEGGLRNQTQNDLKLWNPLAGVSLTFCFNRFFGITGLYRHYFNYETGGVIYSGNRYEAEAFIDFDFFRVFGGYFYDLTSLEGSSSMNHLIRKGPHLGARIYF